VGFTEFLRDGKPVRYFTAFAGRYVRKFNIVRLGRSEAFRRAVQFRAEFEMKAKGATT
jgi:transposase-like protein